MRSLTLYDEDINSSTNWCSRYCEHLEAEEVSAFKRLLTSSLVNYHRDKNLFTSRWTWGKYTVSYVTTLWYYTFTFTVFKNSKLSPLFLSEVAWIISWRIIIKYPFWGRFYSKFWVLCSQKYSFRIYVSLYLRKYVLLKSKVFWNFKTTCDFIAQARLVMRQEVLGKMCSG